MEMLESSIINAIKAIRTIKKQLDKLSIYDFVKKENPSHDTNVVIKQPENHD